MNARPIAFGVVATAAVVYVGMAVAAIGGVIAASPDERGTLIMAAVVGLLVGLAVALVAGLSLAPAYFIERRIGGGALPYAAWGAAVFGALAWRVQGADAALVHGSRLIVLGFVAAGALAGVAFWLGVRRATNAFTSGR